MTSKRPAGALVIAILHFVFGGMGLTCGLCIGIIFGAVGGMRGFVEKMNQFTQQAAKNPGMAKDPQFQQQMEDSKKAMDMLGKREDFFEQKMPLVNYMPHIQLGCTLVFSVMMLVAGMGLLRVRPYGRTWSIIYGLAAIVFVIGMMIFTIVVQDPLDKEFLTQLKAQDPAMDRILAQNQTNPAFAYVFWVIGLIYPIAVLIVMFSGSVKAAYGGGLPETLSGPGGNWDQARAGSPMIAGAERSNMKRKK